ncbi:MULTISPECIES: sugar ABC transporter permease [Mesotoga]|jgi:multiple sugar transport system permease protein|uniref:Permease component of ABC-type sugar transporter n=1 Tax=Mesotoga prima MesG1.Ag.4.2 TaxID=660470 RepID=I2F1T8_9BACT|nr:MULTISPECIES: sugar ABC transporter permease [Mesotoga]AFK05891.1 permease component of ABC-type sugar transporter [Mesotoga prima MesG1.Ag.4.2]MDK2944858.1 multiple sugar transport system permease protein [Mesotoga sp.]PIJ61067.1 ABC transporter permease [Mesotoga sp. H07.pep.5.3]RLL88883.1 ABC transporter permease [Mesotoga sp. H07pep.5.4]HOP38417.1 sugar ABC transporter permease [Mesotoga prima]
MSKLAREEKTAFKMVLPYLLIIVLLFVYLIGSNIYSSFTTEEGAFTLQNYSSVFTDPVVGRSMINTVVWVIGSVLGQLLLGLLVALLLNESTKGQIIFRSIILILPWATLDIVAGVMWKWMYNDMYGVLNDVLVKMNIINDYIPWLATENMAMISVIIANIWKGFCLSGMFFLAGLQTIPPDLYEAAEIDGANSIRRFWRITIPQLKPVIMTTLMLTVIWTINYFPLIYIMTGGGPGYGTETVVTYIYKLGFRFLEFNKAAALSNILFVAIFAIAFVFLRSIAKEEAR